MSLQQQCLPLPRRRKRQSQRNSNDNNKHKTNTSTNSNTSTNHTDMDMDMELEEDSTPQQISDLDGMDATTYLASVSAQAARLPFIFVAPPKEEQEKSLETSTSTSTSTLPSEEAIWQGSAMSVQYLFSHRLKLIPPPTIHHLPPIVVNSTLSLSSTTSSSTTTTTTSMEEYSQFVIHNFSKLRLYLHQCCCCSSTSSTNSGNINNRHHNSHGGNNNNMKRSGSVLLKEEKVPVPPSKDEYNWIIFCLGVHEACGNVVVHDTYYDISSCDEDNDDDDEDDDEDEKNDMHDKTIYHKRNVPSSGYEPTTSLLCQFDQIIIRRVIQHHIQSISKLKGYTTHGSGSSGSSSSSSSSGTYGTYGMSVQRCKWLYALLSRLEKPLHRDEASSLTTLLRELCRLRSEIKVTELLSLKSTNNDDDDDVVVRDNHNNGNYCPKGVLAILNTLIVIIGIYFEQCSGLDSIMKVEDRLEKHE